MAELVSITASIIGITAPALHGIRLLLNDVQNIKDAPNAIQALEDHLHRVSLALSSLQAIEPREWESLGSNIIDEIESTVRICTTACDRFKADLQRWTSHSLDGEFSWRDRAKVGFMKQGQIKSMQGHLQTCQIAINSVVSTATFYSSIQHTRMTEDIKEMISAKQGEITSAAQTTDTQLAEVSETLKTLKILDNIQDTELSEVEMARQLQEEQRSLYASQKLLGEVLTKFQEDPMLRASAEKQDRSAHAIFGSQNSGVQIGVSYGPISGITFGGK